MHRRIKKRRLRADSALFRLPASIGALLPLLLFFLFAASSCVTKEDVYDTGDAWSEIYSAIEYKEKECGQSPSYLLIIPENPPTYGTQLCSISIIRSECPFIDYPAFCLEMYQIDVPGIGP